MKMSINCIEKKHVITANETYYSSRINEGSQFLKEVTIKNTTLNYNPYF